MNKKDRQATFEKYNGKCAYCGCELLKGWHVDHIEPIVRNWINGKCEKPHLKNNIENYNPSCSSCNIQKNSYSLEQFRSNIKQFVSSLNQYSTQYKFAKKYGLLKETDIEVKFYFETINNPMEETEPAPEQIEAYCQKLMAKLKQEPNWELRQEFGTMLMRHINSFTEEEKNRYEELKRLLHK